MKDTIEVYTQPGRYGIHAGARYPARSNAAHKDDPETAAWRCAMKHWFPSRPNGVILYREAIAITMERADERVWKAILEIPDPAVKEFTFARSFTPQLLDSAQKLRKHQQNSAKRKAGKR